jgi:hypothetical protein
VCCAHDQRESASKQTWLVILNSAGAEPHDPARTNKQREQQMAELIMLALLGVLAFAATMSVLSVLD